MAQDILQMLLQSKGNAIGGPTQQNVARALPFPVSILPDLLRMAGVASTAQPGVQGEGQRVAGEMASQLNPMQQLTQKGIKKVEKLQDAQIEQAAAQGVPLQHIITQLVGQGSGAPGAPPAQMDQNVVGGSNEQLTQAMAGQQPMQAQGQPQQGNGIVDMLNNLISLGGLIQPTPQNQYLLSQTALNKQELAGEKPLQKGKAEEIELTALGNLMATGNKAVSAETGKLLGNVRSGMQQIDLLEQAFANDPNAFKQIATPGNAQAQAIQTTMADLTDIIGRLRSGGAINKDEEKRFMAQVPKFGFIAGRMEAPGAVKFKLKKLRNLFNEIEGLTQPDQSGLAGRIQQAVGAGYSMQEIRKRLKAKGEL